MQNDSLASSIDLNSCAEKSLIKQIIGDLEAGKSSQISLIDVRQKCNFCNWFIIANATSNRHAKALAERIEVQQKKHQNPPLSIEGTQVSEWILLDFFDVVVHIMLPEVRLRYALEKLWGIDNTDKKTTSYQAINKQ